MSVKGPQTGDIFRSYHPSGDGRDTHLFMSSASTHPRTSKQFHPEFAPKHRSTFDMGRTAPPARFELSGSGRDGFQGDRAAPRTGKQFNPFKAPSHAAVPMPSTVKHYGSGVRAGYVPNGSGRDLQLFCGGTDVLPKTGTQFSAEAPHPKRYATPFSVSRTDPCAKVRPNGSGRDVFQTHGGGGAVVPHTSIRFNPHHPPSPKRDMPAMRSSPPPKYVPSGSGRDGFHRVDSNEGWSLGGSSMNDGPDAMGFGPKRWDPAARHRPRTGNQKGQRRHAETLSRPRTVHADFAGRPQGFGLLVPGANLRK